MIEAGDRVLLWQPETGRRWLMQVEAGARKVKGLGVFDPARLVGCAWGSGVEIAGKSLAALRPTTADLHGTVRRKAQIITAKDASRIAFELALAPGDRVLESGVGSGAATIVLAAAVGAEGRVVVQELRDDFVQWASENLEAAGLDGRVEMHVGDLTEGLVDGIEGPFDAVLLDQPEPWKAVPHLEGVVAPGARLAAYCPQVGQMEATVHSLGSWADVRAMELIERPWDIKERGARPSFDGLGHTGFLVFARWPPQSDS